MTSGDSSAERAAASKPARPPEPTTGDADSFEVVLARAIDLASAGDEGELERFLVEQGPERERLRQRLADLDRLGLIARLPRAPVRVGAYRVLRELGRGGMASVYLAESEEGGARVALKLAHAPVAGADGSGLDHGGRARARFAREIAAVRELDDARIVGVRDAGEHDGRLWFTMDYVRGATLARVLERLRVRAVDPENLSARDARAALSEDLESRPDDRLAPDQDRRIQGTSAAARDAGADDDGAGAEAWSLGYVDWCVRVALDVARALQHAHARGVVHRDVKPSNVLVLSDGRARLFDFGLAHVDDEPTLTRSGDFAGTPYAVAPEQVDARFGSIGPHTDVWGLGVTLFEALSLRRPFDASGPAALMRRILGEEPNSLRRLHRGVPRDLESVLATALEKSPQRRYPSMDAFASDLAAFGERRPVRARGATWTRRVQRFVRRKPALAAAGALAFAIVVGLPAGLLYANSVVREQARRAERAAGEARAQSDANAEVVRFLVDLFRPRDGADLARELGALPILDDQAERLLSEVGAPQRSRAALLDAAGTVYANLGLAQRALPYLDRALALRQAQLGDAHPDTLGLLELLARVHLEQGRARVALDLCERALHGLEPRPDASPDASPGASTEASTGASVAARSAEHARAALEARVRTTLARATARDGRLAEAADEAERAVQRARAASPGGELEAAALEAQAEVAADGGDAGAALEHARQALALRRRAWSPDALELARALESYAALCARVHGDAEGLADAARREAAQLRAALAADAGNAAFQAPILELADVDAGSYDDAFQGAVTALQARHFDAARAGFERCLEVRPRAAVAMYNLACTHALSGQREQALTWLERAVDAGFGMESARRGQIERDADLAELRGAARFRALLGRLERQSAELLAFARRPAVLWPRGAPEAEPGSESAPSPAPGLLVVLHDDGASKTDVVEGPWRDVARELDLVLLAPNGTLPRGSRVADGFAWFPTLAGFAREPWDRERGVVEDLIAFLDEHEVDPARVFVAGEGSGALLAFDLALRAPGLVRRALLVRGPAWVQGGARRASVAAALGVRVAWLCEPERALVGVAGSTADYGRALHAWLTATGLAFDFAEPPVSGTSGRGAPEQGASDVRERLLRALR